MTATQESTAVPGRMSSRESGSPGQTRVRPLRARFTTPALDLNALVWPRNVPRPSFDLPSPVVDLLVQVGDWLEERSHGLLQEALVAARRPAPLPAQVADRT